MSRTPLFASMLLATLPAVMVGANTARADTPNATSSQHPAPQNPSAENPSTQARSPLAGLCPERIDSRVAASTPRLLVFGEVHGTQQAPAFIYQLACDHVLRAPTQPLLIGLELGHDQHSALQALLRHPDDDCAIRQLLRSRTGRGPRRMAAPASRNWS